MAAKTVLLDLTPEELQTVSRRWASPRSARNRCLRGCTGRAFFRNDDAAQGAAANACRNGRRLPPEPARRVSFQKDETVKFLNACADGNLIESVLMRYHYGYTLCVSTQIGCKMGCAFCASTLHGCVRDLSAGEMLAQVIWPTATWATKPRGHVVLMGSGEPLENYEQTVRFLRLVNRPEGLNLSLRSVSLSTCGLVPEIRRLADEGLPVTLSISLHAPNDQIRRRIMPIANRYPIAELMDAVREYVRKTGRRVVFEYALIAGLNSEPAHARELAGLIGGLQCHVNLIPLNPVKERALAPASPAAAQAFLHTLEALHVSATIRREMGADIAGACGQLRNRHLKAAGKPDNITI
jgi:23S rRNA (adenine2503-C2)-methyltransferase